MELGEMSTNSYVLWEDESKKCLIIDPADDAVAISEEIRVRKLLVKGILLTHGHFDHLMAVAELELMFSVPIYANKQDEFLIKRSNHTAKFFLKRSVNEIEGLKIKVDLDEVAELKLGQARILVVKTPGHTPGSVCFYCPAEKLVFTGDTWLSTGIGSTEHKYSSRPDLLKSLNLLKQLPPETLVLSGHGDEFWL